MTYVPAFYDRAKDTYRRPWQIQAATPWIAVYLSRARLQSEGEYLPLVQVTEAETGESVFKESVTL